MAAKCPATATRLFPDPVGVLRIRFDPETTSMTASSCAGYSVNPRAVAHAANAANNASASPPSRGRWSSRRAEPRSVDEVMTAHGAPPVCDTAAVGDGIVGRGDVLATMVDALDGTL